jgi:hypothetical protein
VVLERCGVHARITSTVADTAAWRTLLRVPQPGLTAAAPAREMGLAGGHCTLGWYMSQRAYFFCQSRTSPNTSNRGTLAASRFDLHACRGR